MRRVQICFHYSQRVRSYKEENSISAGDKNNNNSYRTDGNSEELAAKGENKIRQIRRMNWRMAAHETTASQRVAKCRITKSCQVPPDQLWITPQLSLLLKAAIKSAGIEALSGIFKLRSLWYIFGDIFSSKTNDEKNNELSKRTRKATRGCHNWSGNIPWTLLIIINFLFEAISHVKSSEKREPLLGNQISYLLGRHIDAICC